MSRYKSKMKENVYNKNKITNVGAVIHTNTHVLLVFQRVSKRWGIPKGSIETGESTENAVYREIYEETGLKKTNLAMDGSLESYQNSKYHFTHFKIKNKQLPLVWPVDRKEILYASWFCITDIPINQLNSASRLALRKFKLINDNNHGSSKSS